MRRGCSGSWLLVVGLAGTVALGACGGDGDEASRDPDTVITVGSFNFPENELLAEIYAQALEVRGLPVERELGLASREVVQPALEQGFVDVLPEYLGTALAFVDPAAGASADPATAHARLRDALASRDVTVLAYAAAENKNGVAVTAATAAQYGLRTVSDLIEVAPQLTFGGPPECPDRPFCLPGLERVYGLRFRSFRALDASGPVTVRALVTAEVDAAVMFTTDGELAEGEFVMLDDDRGLQPAENIVPVVRTPVLRRHGEGVRAALDDVTGRLTTEDLIELNLRLDRGEPVEQVAADWLRSVGVAPEG